MGKIDKGKDKFHDCSFLVFLSHFYCVWSSFQLEDLSNFCKYFESYDPSLQRDIQNVFSSRISSGRIIQEAFSQMGDVVYLSHNITSITFAPVPSLVCGRYFLQCSGNMHLFVHAADYATPFAFQGGNGVVRDSIYFMDYEEFGYFNSISEEMKDSFFRRIEMTVWREEDRKRRKKYLCNLKAPTEWIVCVCEGKEGREGIFSL
jgi:hypothetical protein